MVVLATLLSLFVGLSLGLLGGGGSILMLPILLHVVHSAPRQAIGMSLLVVGLASLVGTLMFLRVRLVRWKTGLVFGLVGMVGAYAGGRLAHSVPAPILLTGFSVMMLLTGIAMLRPRVERPDAEQTGRVTPAAALRLVGLGLGVGLITGLVGAGGGFVVVPALALFARLPMREAVGTSLLVITLNAFAGFAGHMSHIEVDWTIAVATSVAALAGVVVGTQLAGRLSQQLLRRLFGGFLIVLGLVFLARHLPDAVRASALYQRVFVARWPWPVGGLALGGFVLSFLWLDNKLLGVSTGYAELCELPRKPELHKSWRPSFLLGIVFGGVVAGLLGGAGHGVTLALGSFDARVGTSLLVKLPVLLLGGLLLGYGARTAGGCTSGHTIVGVAQGGRASLVSSVAFLTGGAVTALVIERLLN